MIILNKYYHVADLGYRHKRLSLIHTKCDADYWAISDYDDIVFCSYCTKQLTNQKIINKAKFLGVKF